MIALFVYIVLIVALIIIGIYYAVFTPHKLNIYVENKVVKIWFGLFKIVDTSKKKKCKKTKVKSSYVKIPTPDTAKRIAKNALQVYAAEKDEAIFVIKEIFANCCLERCDLSVTFGTGDAALTAILYGVGWQLITAVYSKVIKNEDLRKNINIAFTPMYEDTLFSYKTDIKLKVIIIKHLKLFLRGYKIYKRNKAKFI